MPSDFEVKLQVIAKELDPTKKYILEVRQGDFDTEAMRLLSKGLYQLGITNILVSSPDGNSIKVTELPEELSNAK